MPGNIPGAIVPAVPFPSPVPLPVLGTGLVTVSFDVGWLPYVIGACKTLTANSTYDPPTDAQVAAATSAAYDLLRILSEAVLSTSIPKAFGSSGADEGQPMLRQNPDNPCQLQTSVDGVTWCTWADISKCTPNPAPGGGTTPPGAGKCNDYTVRMDSHVLTPLPFVVNTGDTIQLESAAGAATDGLLHWYCPDGSIFLLGACNGGGGVQPGDPLNTSNHMMLLWKIGSNFYPVSNTLFTIPGGVTNSPIYLTVNNPSLTNVAGDFTVKFNFCNNQAVTSTWCYDLDFTVSPFAVTPRVTPGVIECTGTFTESAGVWSSGSGWHGLRFEETGCATFGRLGYLALDLGASVALTSAEMKGTITAPGHDNTVACAFSSANDFSTDVNFVFNHANVTASPYDFSASLSLTKRYVLFYLNFNGDSGTPDGDAVCSHLILHGTGANPFGPSNCT